MTGTAISNVPAAEFGPAMRALHTRWQRAVLALFHNGGNKTAALRAAGYKSDNLNSLKASAWKLFSDDRIRAAVHETAGRMIEMAEPELLAVVTDIMRDNTTDPRDRLRAAAMIWDRANPVLTRHKVEVEHHVSVDELDVQHYRALQKLGAPQQAFLDRFGVNGIERVQQMVAAEDTKAKVIETDYHEEKLEAAVEAVDAVVDADIEVDDDEIIEPDDEIEEIDEEEEIDDGEG